MYTSAPRSPAGPAKAWLVACAAAFLVEPAAAYLVTINNTSRGLYLQVGTGTGRFTDNNSAGTLADNTSVNLVSVTVPAASVGAGTQNMTSNSNVAISPFDNYVYCDVPAEVYVGGFYRGPGSAPGSARLRVDVPASLTSATGDTISFNTISWISGGNGDTTATIPSGTFVANSTQTLLTVARNRWFESCLAFRYANTQIVPAGTFNGQVTYTLSAP
jgi:hypothetical protein